MVDDGNVHVIDWQEARINELEYDLASTHHILLLLLPSFGDEKIYTNLAHDYLEIYRSQIDIDEDKLDYYLGVRCLVGLGAMEAGYDVFSLPGVCERTVKRFKEISGINLIRPATNK
jgi:hypothetical protein